MGKVVPKRCVVLCRIKHEFIYHSAGVHFNFTRQNLEIMTKNSYGSVTKSDLKTIFSGVAHISTWL